MQAEMAGSEQPALDIGGKYLSITTYKKDGTAVATPVWFVEEDGLLFVETDGDSGKVKRIKRNSSIAVAPCGGRGRLHGQPVRARAEILPETALPHVEQLLEQKYHRDMIMIKPFRAVQGALHIGRARGKPVVLRITAA